MLGEASKSTEPRMEQIFVENTKNLPSKEFDAELFKLRKFVERIMANSPHSFYCCSLSSQTITYKGQFTPEQVFEYFHDLKSPEFSSHLALVHSRFSTNTFPSWERAQPNRMMCHNGEINTLKGNQSWMYSRSGLMSSPLFSEEKTPEEILNPTSNNKSDSGNFDSVLELLAKASPREIPECMMMMIPEAWQQNPHLSATKKAFYQYNSCVLEPWDGPAMIAFTDGRYIGATLDRNGLRPSRYYITNDDTLFLSSEIGVIPDLPDENVAIKARLEPGKMFLIDLEAGKMISDHTIKEQTATKYNYQEWVNKNLFSLQDWVVASKIDTSEKVLNIPDMNRRLIMFGYSVETLDMLLYPMSISGIEALGSMGNDAALAVISQKPRLLFDYFKQLFAQVTNPPIDPIREELVMSLMCPVGPEQNLLSVSEQHCSRMVVEHPVMSLNEMEALKTTSFRGWTTATIDCTIPKGSTSIDFKNRLDDLCTRVHQAVKSGNEIIILSDRAANEENIPIPSLITIGTVHQYLLRNKLRSNAAVFLECGDAKEVHDFALLLGYGADGVVPYVAYECLANMNQTGYLSARTQNAHHYENEELFYSYRKAIEKGIMKVMSKMGISTLQSYKGAQVFEAVGLNEEIMIRCFPNTHSRLKGINFDTLLKDMKQLHVNAYVVNESFKDSPPSLMNSGQYHFRNSGEAHLNTPEGMHFLQESSRVNSRELFTKYTQNVNETVKKITIRGLLKFNHEKVKAIPLEEVEDAKSIVKRFNTGAMSLGSISREAHETLATAMNQIGGRSNTGEGGEDPVRFKDNRRSAIKQVASGRFGVTSHYLANSDQIQIKIAQGAKPGEGGELPYHKVTDYIAQNRMTTPGVGLISPPPHHDIYSIEDLAQLIHDLKNAQPNGEVSVKLVSEVGVGIVAAGVVKAKADHITISGGDGGTGAAAWTGIKNAGLPWELGIAEAHQTLLLNNLRSRVKLQTDGQLKTGRDIVIAAILGAEEFGFATAPLITLGCIMMRKCHLNTCPVGIATQDPELRAKFKGRPESVINFFFLLAEEIREYMASLGIKNMNELIGRTDLISLDKSLLTDKTKGLDLSAILQSTQGLSSLHETMYKSVEQNHLLEQGFDHRALPDVMQAIEKKIPVSVEYPVNNLDRTVGTRISYEISKRYGAEGLPNKTIRMKLVGHGGQSLGFALTKGVHLEVEGDSNDYVGKSLSGGTIAVYPTKGALDRGFKAEDNVIIGNVCLYGATSGKAFFRGKAGERFAVRNSGAHTVVEGMGAHGCEYMTGGTVVCLGETGQNFAAGMSGGIAYIYDPKKEFPDNCNMKMVNLETLSETEELNSVKALMEEHVSTTRSALAGRLLANWSQEVQHFVKVMPIEYARVLEEKKALLEAQQAPKPSSSTSSVPPFIIPPTVPSSPAGVTTRLFHSKK
jgi:glutamate synthase (NADPH/NADH)